jgi:hypothetical protein
MASASGFGLSREGYSVGWFGFTHPDGRKMWSADAKRGDDPKLIVQAKDLGAAFAELEVRCRNQERRLKAFQEADEVAREEMAAFRQTHPDTRFKFRSIWPS